MFYVTLGGKKEERKGVGFRGGVPVLGHLCPKNWDLAKSYHLNRGVLPTRLNHVFSGFSDHLLIEY